jgi:hypothetical protein
VGCATLILACALLQRVTTESSLPPLSQTTDAASHAHPALWEVHALRTVTASPVSVVPMASVRPAAALMASGPQAPKHAGTEEEFVLQSAGEASAVASQRIAPAACAQTLECVPHQAALMACRTAGSRAQTVEAPIPAVLPAPMPLHAVHTMHVQVALATVVSARRQRRAPTVFRTGWRQTWTVVQHAASALWEPAVRSMATVQAACATATASVRRHLASMAFGTPLGATVRATLIAQAPVPVYALVVTVAAATQTACLGPVMH